MLSNNVGSVPVLELLLQQQLLLLYLKQDRKPEEQKTIVRGVSWLRDPLSTSNTEHSKEPPEVGSWTCPRCRSHRCIRVNPGDARDPVYCCSVCGYTFHKTSAATQSETRHEQ
jgi:hypothetical protein